MQKPIFFSAIFARGLSGGFAIDNTKISDSIKNSSWLESIRDKLYNLKTFVIQKHDSRPDMDYAAMELFESYQPKKLVKIPGELPWHLTEDLKNFKRITTQSPHSVLIMGRNTFESLPENGLFGRQFVVISKSLKNLIDNHVTKIDPSVRLVASFQQALQVAHQISNGDSNAIFVIGGVNVLEEAFRHPGLEKVYETVVLDKHQSINYTRYFTEYIPTQLSEIVQSRIFTTRMGLKYQCYEYTRCTDERHYLEILSDLVDLSSRKENLRLDRTGTGVFSIFCPDNIIVDLKEGFPLLTTKHVSFKNIAEELLWMIRGETHNKYLQEKGVKIWNGNSTRSFLDKQGLQRFEEGQLGKIYGHQFRNFGGNFDSSKRSQIGNGGFDQINYVLNLLRTDPFSRRIVIDLWNPNDFTDQALAPCHYSCQFFVNDNSALSQTNSLSCKLIQRSGDNLLGIPYNMSSYALLTHMIAATVGLDVGSLFVSVGDCHLYSNHVQQAKTQLSRAPRQFPKLKIVQSKDKLEDYTLSDFEITEYYPHGPIKAVMAI